MNPLSMSTSLIEQHAASRAATLAVVDETRSISWEQLEAESARLATQLPPERGLIALTSGRNVESVIAVAACLRRNYPFLLLDDDVPPNRLDWILADSGAAALIRRKSPAAGVTIDLLRRDRTAAASADEYESSLDSSEIYRVYTSGSTGRPKGIAVSTSSVDSLVAALAERIPELDSSHCIGLTASFGFDAALQQIFLALSLGRTLAIPTDRTRRAADRLTAFWASHGVDLVDGTPTLLRILAAAGVSTPLLPNCYLIGGEVLRADDVRQFWKVAGKKSVYNLYGVAECTVDSVAGKITQLDVESYTILPVGTALTGSIVTLAPHGESPDTSVDREIYIGGTGVALSYPRQTGQFANSVVHFAETGRSYRTGDLGHLLPDGRLVVVGRADRQIKIAGRRVDPAEIEAVLAECARRVVKSPTAEWTMVTHARRCQTCVLSESYPGAQLDDTDQCAYCRMPAEDIRSGWGYFRTIDDLTEKVAATRERDAGEYDAVLLFSGGKDSTYALYRLQDLGFRLFAFTFDNGYISDGAIANIDRICEQTGTPHRYFRPDDAAAMFRESLGADATVCSGCFRGITSWSSRLAADLAAPFVVSGLSRAQILETKLLPFVRRGRLDLSAIDIELHSFHRSYVNRQDRVATAVGANVGSPAISGSQPLDFFRYENVTGDQIRQYLSNRDSHWSKPADTGMCSSNCRANDAGINTHVSVRRFHNYEGPLSWEVRLGVISRTEAIEQIVAPPLAGNVRQMQEDLSGNLDVAVVRDGLNRLIGIVEGTAGLDRERLGHELHAWLPDFMQPHEILEVDEIPRLPSGKVDYRALAAIHSGRGAASTVEATSEIERAVLRLWQTAVGTPPTARDADFFSSGGDSLGANELAARLRASLGIKLPGSLVFESPTFQGLCQIVDRAQAEGVREAAGPISLESLWMPSSTKSPEIAYYLFPGATGNVPAHMSRLFLSVAQSIGADVTAVRIDHGVWDPMETVKRVAEMIAGEHVEAGWRRRIRLVGWSAGAFAADAVARQLAGLAPSRGRLIEAWLLDPPTTAEASVELADCLAQLSQGVATTFPSLRRVIRASPTWSGLREAVDRAATYREGALRLETAVPVKFSTLLGLDMPAMHLGEPRVAYAVRMLSALASSIAAGQTWEGGASRGPKIVQRVVRSGRRHTSSIPDTLAEYGFSEAEAVDSVPKRMMYVLPQDDHVSMLDTRHATFYAALESLAIED